MNKSPAYTPLESLLLFQSLEAYGTHETSFTKISQLLTENDLVRHDQTFDTARLTAAALQDLYLHLLGDELRVDGERNVDEDASSKKRKLSTPALPTLKDAQKYEDKVPGLVDRLYSRYRERMVAAIVEDERRYRDIQREIEEIERGEWDERIAKEDEAAGRPRLDERPTTNGAGPLLAPPRAPEIPAAAPNKSPNPAPRIETKPGADTVGVNDATNTPQEAPKAIPKPLNGNTNAPPSTQSPRITGPRGPSPLQPPIQPVIPAAPIRWEPPYDPGRQFQPAPYAQHGYPQYNQQYAPSQYHNQPPFSPRGLPPHQFPVPSSPHAGAQSPVLLPPPGSALRQPGSPAMPLDALADIASQQYQASSRSPMQPPNQHGQYPQHGPPTPGHYGHQASPSPGPYPPYPPQHQRPNSGPSPNGQPPQWNQPQQQMQPPYQNGPQNPQQPFYPPQNFPPQNRQPVSPQTNPASIDSKHYNSPYNPNLARQSLPGNGPRPSLPSTPVARVDRRFSTGLGTQWTERILGSATPRPQSKLNLDSPAYEPLSPPLAPASLPIDLPTSKKSTKKTPKDQKQKPTAISTSTAKSKVPNRKGRDVSVASSVPASIMSQNDSNVKEEITTPRLLDEETGSTTEADLPPPRQAPSQKRKRSIQSQSDTPLLPQEAPSSQVLWTRNFPKISASALEQVATHKHAALFRDPIKDRDARGYSKIILRPQDLKSIKAAITNGNKAAIAAEASLPEDSSKSTKESTILLPISEDLIPPKGIVNYSQLEKELMRMFANAVMFNQDPSTKQFAERLKSPGKGKGGGDGYEIDEDGVVRNTLEMFGDVETIIGGLRNAERLSGERVGDSGKGETSKGKATGSARGGSLARGGSVRGSSVVPTDDGEEEEVEVPTNTGGSVAKRRRKA